jgi:hypothetical protein
MVPEPPSAITTLLHADIVTVTVLLLFGDSPSLLDTVLVDTVLYIVGLIEFLPSVTPASYWVVFIVPIAVTHASGVLAIHFFIFSCNIPRKNSFLTS